MALNVFRIFDAMNDVRNLKTAIEATIANDGHAQGTLAYTVSPVHTREKWVDMAKELEDLGCHSICIKDMAGLLRPYEAEALIRDLKANGVRYRLPCNVTPRLGLVLQPIKKPLMPASTCSIRRFRR